MTQGQIAAHARTLAADAEAFGRCAETLREARARLRDQPAAPSWLIATLDVQISACLAAADRFAEAAGRLNALVGSPRRPNRRPTRRPGGEPSESGRALDG